MVIMSGQVVPLQANRKLESGARRSDWDSPRALMGRAAGQARGVSGILNLNLRPSLPISKFKFNLKLRPGALPPQRPPGRRRCPQPRVLPITCQVFCARLSAGPPAWCCGPTSRPGPLGPSGPMIQKGQPESVRLAVQVSGRAPGPDSNGQTDHWPVSPV